VTTTSYYAPTYYSSGTVLPSGGTYYNSVYPSYYNGGYYGGYNNYSNGIQVTPSGAYWGGNRFWRW
jgi:hypothetical protein